MIKNDVGLCYTAYEKMDEKGNVTGCNSVPSKVKYTDLLKVNSIGCLTSMYDKNRVGDLRMPSLRKRQDLGLWLSMLKVVDYAYEINQVTAQYRIRNNSISSRKSVASLYTWKLYCETENLGFFSAAYYFIHYAFNGLIRTRFPRIEKYLNKI